MPSIIEYAAVVQTMQRLGMQCQYFNSGAFGFDAGAMCFTGWLGPADSTIRPAAAERAIQIAEPHVRNLTDLACRAWQTFFPGPAWIMPRSHWAYELDFGSKTWMPAVLREIGIDPAALKTLTNAPAIQFNADELMPFQRLTESLLYDLLGSDFSLAFPDHPVIATLHHHKQVWWMSNDPSRIEAIRDLAMKSAEA